MGSGQQTARVAPSTTRQAGASDVGSASAKRLRLGYKNWKQQLEEYIKTAPSDVLVDDPDPLRVWLAGEPQDEQLDVDDPFFEPE